MQPKQFKLNCNCNILGSFNDILQRFECLKTVFQYRFALLVGHDTALQFRIHKPHIKLEIKWQKFMVAVELELVGVVAGFDRLERTFFVLIQIVPRNRIQRLNFVISSHLLALFLWVIFLYCFLIILPSFLWISSWFLSLQLNLLFILLAHLKFKAKFDWSAVIVHGDYVVL